jgi:cysteine synthase
MNTDKLSQIGNTPLIEFNRHVPNQNRIWIKLECENPFGSHYDRVYLELFRHFERQGLLKPGDTVIETTSGSAGVSFAGIGRLLGYKCLVAIPEGGEKAREDAIKREGAELIFTPADAYVSGFPRFIKRFLVTHRNIVFLNHSMGPGNTENTVATSALAGIAKELQQQLDPIDYFIAAVGNGSSILGPGRILRDRTKIVTFEPFQSAVAFELMYPNRYEEMYGIKPGTLPRHRMPGTSYQGIDFPHIRISFKDEPMVSETRLVSDAKTDKQYQAMTGKTKARDLPHWDSVELQYGRTTQAGLAVALRVAETVTNQNFVIVAYDKPDRYDPTHP